VHQSVAKIPFRFDWTPKGKLNPKGGEAVKRQDLVEQRATNAQTVQFVADRAAEIASSADQLAKKDSGWSAVAAAAREHRRSLMEVAQEEKRLATQIQLGSAPDSALAARERELRKDLLEIARAEGQMAEELWEREQQLDDPTPGVLAEQAERNLDLLRHVAGTASGADRALRNQEQADTERN
jgi:hypothetical protein